MHAEELDSVLAKDCWKAIPQLCKALLHSIALDLTFLRSIRRFSFIMGPECSVMYHVEQKTGRVPGQSITLMICSLAGKLFLNCVPIQIDSARTARALHDFRPGSYTDMLIATRLK